MGKKGEESTRSRRGRNNVSDNSEESKMKREINDDEGYVEDDQGAEEVYVRTMQDSSRQYKVSAIE